VNRFAANSGIMKKMPLKKDVCLANLSKDHPAGLLFSWKLRQGVKYHIEADRIIKYIKYFWSHHFSGHFKEEEEFLFAPVKNEEVKKALEDHQKIKTFVEKIGVSGMESEENILLEFADTVDAHIRFEEKVLFPHLEESLSDEQLKKIRKQLVHEPFVDQYEDKFWIKSNSL
jgi:hemerythrin-like domain-containing protein